MLCVQTSGHDHGPVKLQNPIRQHSRAKRLTRELLELRPGLRSLPFSKTSLLQCHPQNMKFSATLWLLAQVRLRARLQWTIYCAASQRINFLRLTQELVAIPRHVCILYSFTLVKERADTMLCVAKRRPRNEGNEAATCESSWAMQTIVCQRITTQRSS